MSDLLNSASLIMIPSGYKEDILYSEIPTNGSGDMAFTRASNGTRINSAGLVEVAPWNICDYSEDQTQWTSQNETTVTANTITAPNGTTTADTVTPSTVNDDHYRGIILSPQVGALTAFIYVKPNGYNFFDWGIYNGSQYIVRATFDLVNLTYTFTNAGTATIESVGNGWLKCGISGTNASLSTMSLYYRSRPTGGTGVFTGNGTSGAFLWGAQLNIGSTAKPYFPTTDRLNVPRLTYQNGGGGCPSLLLEKQSTNIALYSEQFDNAGWSKSNATITANATTSPDGTQNADKLIANTTSASHLIQQTFTPLSATSYTLSTYAKAGEYNFVGLQIAFGGINAYASFNLSTGVVFQSGGGATATIQNMGNGWYRCLITATTISTASSIFNIRIENDGSLNNFVGNNVDGIYAWGAQLEQSSYSTSYIPTTSSSATRVADVAQKTGISSLIGQTSGTIFLDYNLITASQDIVVMNAVGLPNNDIAMIFIGNSLEIYCFNNFIEQFRFSLNGYKNTNRYKIAIGYSNNDVACYINGTLVGTDTSCTFNITDSIFYTSADYNAHLINESVLFKTRLTNAELIALTS